MPSEIPAGHGKTDGVKLMAKVYREGRMEFLETDPNASEIETVEAGMAAVLKALERGE